MTAVMQVLVSDDEAPGGWLALQSVDGILILTADTFANASSTLKRITASNPLLAGTFTVRALPDTITETVGVYVDHPDAVLGDVVVEHLIALFQRVRFNLRWQHDSLDVLMVAQAADYVRSTSREFRHAGRTQLTFSVPVLPGRLVL